MKSWHFHGISEVAFRCNAKTNNNELFDSVNASNRMQSSNIVQMNKTKFVRFFASCLAANLVLNTAHKFRFYPSSAFASEWSACWMYTLPNNYHEIIFAPSIAATIFKKNKFLSRRILRKAIPSVKSSSKMAFRLPQINQTPLRIQTSLEIDFFSSILSRKLRQLIHTRKKVSVSISMDFISQLRMALSHVCVTNAHQNRPKLRD